MDLNMTLNVWCEDAPTFSDFWLPEKEKWKKKEKKFAINLKESDPSHSAHTANTLGNVPDHMQLLSAESSSTLKVTLTTLKQPLLACIALAELIVYRIDFWFN